MAATVLQGVGNVQLAMAGKHELRLPVWLLLLTLLAVLSALLLLILWVGRRRQNHDDAHA